MRASEFIVERFLVELTDKARKDAISRFEAELEANPDIELTDRERTRIRRCVELWSKHGSGDIFRLSFDQAYRIVDNNLLKQELKGRATEQLDPDIEPEAEPDYKNLAPEDSDLIIYLGNTKKKCIAYGDGYEFCISRKDGSNLYGDYRYEHYKTFYFVRNPNKPESDNTHLIVINVDINGNFEYTLSNNERENPVGQDWDSIVALEPELAELKHLFVYVEPTAEELRRHRLSTLDFSLDQYQALSPRDKFYGIEAGRYLEYYEQDLVKVEGDPVLSQLLIGAYVKRRPDHFTVESWNRLSKGDQRYVRNLVERRFQEDQFTYFESMVIVRGKDPFSKDELIAILEQDGRLISRLILAGIDIDEDLQLAAVRQDGLLIRNIIEEGIIPSDDVQLAAVENSYHAFEYILQFQYTLRPSERVQLAAVKQNPNLLLDILRYNIIPSERVQLAAVSKDPTTIQQILDAKIRPSEQVQLAAVKAEPLLIINIINANSTDPIIPSEAVQIAAVIDNPGLLDRIRQRGITPSPNVVAAAEKAANRTGDSFRYYDEEPKEL